MPPNTSHHKKNEKMTWGAHGGVQMEVNGQKLNFQANGRKWWDKGVETAWNCFLSVYIIAIASSTNIFVNQSGGGIKGLPISRRKWG